MDNPLNEKLSLDYNRRYGLEIELNSFDKLDRPPGYLYGKLPEGINYIGNLVRKTTKQVVSIHKWANDHNNDCWIIKPDGSCGIEVCTPVSKGWHDLKKICKVVEEFQFNDKIQADERCSVHIHIEVTDLLLNEVASILTWWIKCELFFLDIVSPFRRNNRYCQSIYSSPFMCYLESDFLNHESLIKNLGEYKYFSANTFHMHKKKRKTLEFRVMGNQACKDAWDVKNWTRLILHFVEMAVKRGMPKSYIKDDYWTGYHLLDPIYVFEFLGFMYEDEFLSEGIKQIRHWLLQKMIQNQTNCLLRKQAREEIKFLVSRFPCHDNLTINKDLYSNKYRI